MGQTKEQEDNLDCLTEEMLDGEGTTDGECYYFVGRSCPPRVPLRDSMFPHKYSNILSNYSPMMHLSDEDLIQVGPRAFAEVKIERIRKQNYPHLPTRQGDMFFWKTLEEARSYQISGEMGEEKGLVYMYKVTELYKPVFVADLLLFNVIARFLRFRNGWKVEDGLSKPFLKPTFEETLDELCHNYWQGKFLKDLDLSGCSRRELIVSGKAEVLGYVRTAVNASQLGSHF